MGADGPGSVQQDRLRSTANQTDLTATARRALEEVCSGKNLGGIPGVYHPEFIDHVNAMEYRGHDGARQSVTLYLDCSQICASKSTNR